MLFALFGSFDAFCLFLGVLTPPTHKSVGVGVSLEVVVSLRLNAPYAWRIMACCRPLGLFFMFVGGLWLSDPWVESFSVLMAFSSVSSWHVCNAFPDFFGIEVGGKFGTRSVFACSKFSPSCSGVGGGTGANLTPGGVSTGVSSGGSQALVESVSVCTIELVEIELAIEFV